MDRPKDIGKVCRLLSISRSSLHYQPVKNDQELTEHLERLSRTAQGFTLSKALGLKIQDCFFKFLLSIYYLHLNSHPY